HAPAWPRESRVRSGPGGAVGANAPTPQSARQSGRAAPSRWRVIVSSRMRIRVVCWNIHKGIGGIDRRYDLDRIIDAILEEEPDVALLQEVADGMPQLRFEDQAWLLSEGLEMPHIAYGPEHRFSRGGYGNLILSR